MRRACLDCAIKHLSQAQVLLDESVLGYPIHRALAMGHMAEAESELIAEFLPMAEQIREERIKMQEDQVYQPGLMELIELLWAARHPPKKED